MGTVRTSEPQVARADGISLLVTQCVAFGGRVADRTRVLAESAR